jgi:hypothetical protein
MQGLAVILFCILLAIQRPTPEHTTDKVLLRLAVWLMLLSLPVGVIAVFADQKKAWAVCTILAFLPLLTIMGMLQGFW